MFVNNNQFKSKRRYPSPVDMATYEFASDTA